LQLLSYVHIVLGETFIFLVFRICRTQATLTALVCLSNLWILKNCCSQFFLIYFPLTDCWKYWGSPFSRPLHAPIPSLCFLLYRDCCVVCSFS
jgi:hypothetical protein